MNIIITLLALNCLGTFTLVLFALRPYLKWEQKPKPIHHENSFKPDIKLSYSTAVSRLGYYVPKGARENEIPFMATHYTEATKEGDLVLEADNYLTEDGRIFGGQDFRASFVEVPVAQDVRVAPGGRKLQRVLPPTHNVNRLDG